ncbi:MAG: hypothetical protein EPN20_18280 [Magnetospirillum sp.]|nr:MAG: hypothetical protein EPN20_18280 [Magnetospirillum sp.]
MAGSSSSIWLRLAQSLRTIWDDETGAHPAESVKAGSQTAKPKHNFTVETAADRLQDLLQRDPSLKAKLHIVSLVEFREWVGEKWPRLATKVGLIVEQVIRRHVGAGNPFCQDGEDRWIIAFPELSPEEARQRTVAVVEDLGRHLFGEQSGEGQRAVAVATEISVSEAVSDDGELNVIHVQAAIDQSRAFVSSGTVSDSINQWKPMERTDPSRREEMAWEVIEGSHGAKAPAFDPDMVAPLPPAARLSLVWRPTWVASGEAISAYGARVIRIDHEGAEALEGCRAYPPGDVNAALRLDRFVVSTAVRDISAAIRSGDAKSNQASAIVPISWASLSSEQRNTVVIPFSELTEDTRNTRLVIEIFGIPDGTTTPELESVVSYVKALCREVLVRTRMSAKRSSLAAEIGVSMVGLDLSELRPDERMDDESLLATLSRVQEATARDGIGCYLWSARRRRVVGGVVQSGFEMVNGPGLMKDIGRPAIVMPAPRSRFIAA